MVLPLMVAGGRYPACPECRKWAESSMIDPLPAGTFSGDSLDATAALLRGQGASPCSAAQASRPRAASRPFATRSSGCGRA